MNVAIESAPHRLSCLIISIPIVDTQTVGQGHQIQRHRIRRWLAFYDLQDGEK